MSSEHYVLCAECGTNLRVCDCTRTDNEDHASTFADLCDYVRDLEARVR